MRKTILMSNVNNFALFERYSSIVKLRRVTAWILRFAKNCLKGKTDRQHGPLSVAELDYSLTALVRIVQSQAFSADIRNLKSSEPKLCKSNLISLHPFLANNGILRVGGRIKESNFAFDKKHPIILPKNNLLTDMIIKHEHVRLSHCGAQTLLASLRDRFWPISAFPRIKKLIRNCIICFKCNPSQSQYLMENLPNYRSSPSNTFQNCGIGYAGPYTLKYRTGRGSKTYKGVYSD